MTLNTHTGIITTASGTTAADACEAFGLSNSKILSTDLVQINIMAYSGTYGTNGIPTVAVSALSVGSCTVQICNAGSGNLAGTLKLAFWVLKQ